jgi:hypothetical protein
MEDISMKVLKMISALCAFSLLLNTAGICAMEEAAEKSAATIVKEFVTEEYKRLFSFTEEVVVPVATDLATIGAMYATLQATSKIPNTMLKVPVLLIGTAYAGYFTNRLCDVTCRMLGMNKTNNNKNIVAVVMFNGILACFAFLYMHFPSNSHVYIQSI